MKTESQCKGGGKKSFKDSNTCQVSGDGHRAGGVERGGGNLLYMKICFLVPAVCAYKSISIA